MNDNKVFAYMRISTAEERGKQKFDRQEQAITRWAKENNVTISPRRIFKDDASGKSFDRPEWRELEGELVKGATVVFKDICRFTREYDNGFTKYMELYHKGINLVFIDNPCVSTDYIRTMYDVAQKQERIAKKSLENTIELLLLVELDRAEKERQTIVKRIKDGIAASPKHSGRPVGKLDKMTPQLRSDIEAYIAQGVTDRRITIAQIMKWNKITRNTATKYINIVKDELKQKAGE